MGPAANPNYNWPDRKEPGNRELIIQLIEGAVGGNAVGAGLKNFSIGAAGNSIAGAIGGLGGGQLLGMLGTSGEAAAAAGGFDIAGLLGAASGVAVLTAVIWLIKNKMMG